MTEETKKTSILNKKPDELTVGDNIKMSLVTTAAGAVLMVGLPMVFVGVAGAIRSIAEKRAIKKAQKSEDPT